VTLIPQKKRKISKEKTIRFGFVLRMRADG